MKKATGDTPGTPRILERLLLFLASSREKESLSGDMGEVYLSKSKTSGRLRANGWYLVCIVRMAPGVLLNTIKGSIRMCLSYSRSTLRSMVKQKGYTAINISGLAIGLTCCILMFLWVWDEYRYDTFHEKAENIYRIESNLNTKNEQWIWSSTPDPLAAALKEDFGEIEQSLRMKRGWRHLVKRENLLFYEQGFYYAEPSFFEVFSFNLLRGDRETVLQDPFSVLLSERMSKKYFGEENPVGQTITVNARQDFIVSGILENSPHFSHLQIDFIAPFKALELMGEKLNQWGRYDFLTYVVLNGATDPEEFENKIAGYIKKYRRESTTQLILMPLKKIHFESVDGKGDKVYVYLFSLIGFLVLVIASINYINLSTARSAQRAREIGIRKVVGANRSDLINQIIMESLFMSALAFLLSILLLSLSLPMFARLSGKIIPMNIFLQPEVLLGAVAIVSLTGILSGIYPALYLAAIRPVRILRGLMKASGKRSSLRKILVTAQFSISIILIFVSITIYKQLNFIKNKNLGFDQERIAYIVLNQEAQGNTEVLKNELLKFSAIEGVAAADRVPVDMGNFRTLSEWDGNVTAKQLRFHAMTVDSEYLDLMGMAIIEGRWFRPQASSDDVIINEEAVKQMGIESPLGKKIATGNGIKSIVGVMKNFHFKPLQQEIKPLVIMQDTKRLNHLLVKIKPGAANRTIPMIRNEVQKLSPDSPFQYGFIEERIDGLYRSEQRIGSVFKYFTLLTIFVTCLGLLGLAAFTAEQKTKEIGIRKVMGATTSGIVSWLSSTFINCILLANLIAWPIAYFSMKRWLQNFAYRTTIGIETFILAALLSLCVAVLTVGFQSLKAALANPVDCLRCE